MEKMTCEKKTKGACAPLHFSKSPAQTQMQVETTACYYNVQQVALPVQVRTT